MKVMFKNENSDNKNRFKDNTLKHKNIMPDSVAFKTNDINDAVVYDTLYAIQNTYDLIETTMKSRFVNEDQRLEHARLVEEDTDRIEFLEAKIDGLRIMLGEVMRNVKDVDQIRDVILKVNNNDELAKSILDIAIFHSCSR